MRKRGRSRETPSEHDQIFFVDVEMPFPPGSVQHPEENPVRQQVCEHKDGAAGLVLRLEDEKEEEEEPCADGGGKADRRPSDNESTVFLPRPSVSKAT